MPRFQPEHFARNLALVDAVVDLARRKRCTAAQFALAWVLTRRPFIVPIPGTRSTARLEENLDAIDLALSADDLRALDAVLPPGAAAGERYQPQAMRLLDG
jgi:aryl-alcohol dehydrogenase-like predicted oxidoreductase